MKPHIKLLFGETISLGTSFFAAIQTWQEQLDWMLRLLASLVAIIAGIVSIWFALKRRKTPPV